MGDPPTSRLRAWRVEQGLSLEEVADLTGLSVSTISRVERRERDLLALTKVRVARALGVRVSVLFETSETKEVEATG